VNITSRDWMWMVSGFSLLLLVGCAEESTSSSMKTKTPTVSMNTPAEQKIAYAPDALEKLKVKKEDKKADKDKEPMELVSNTKVSTIPSGSFMESEHLKPVYFDLHSSKISEEAMVVLSDNAAWIKTQPPFLLEIVGVTDQRGSSSRNKTLAERRAMNVKKAYMSFGIDAERIQIVSLGEETERCTDLTEDCFKLSRRADTKIEQKALLAQR